MPTSAKFPGFQSEDITRREFVVDTLKKFGAIVFGVFTISGINSCSDDSNPAREGGNEITSITIDLTEGKYKNLTTIGGVLATGANDLDSKGLLFFRPNESLIKAFSRECPHDQCTLRSFQAGISSCPCHGSKFNTNGFIIKGPATSPLKGYNTSLNGNILTISK